MKSDLAKPEFRPFIITTNQKADADDRQCYVQRRLSTERTTNQTYVKDASYVGRIWRSSALKQGETYVIVCQYMNVSRRFLNTW